MADGHGLFWLDDGVSTSQVPESSAGASGRELEQKLEELAAVRRELASKTVQLLRESTENAALRKKLQNAEEDLAHAKQALAARSEPQGPSDELTAAQKSIEALTTANAELREQLEARSKRIQDLELAVDNATQLASQEQNRRLTLENATDSEFDAVVAELHKLEDVSRHQLAAKDELIARLQAQADAAGSELQNRKAEVQAAADATIASLHESIDAAAAREDELRHEVRQLRAALDHAASGGELASAHLEELGTSRSRLVQLQAELDSYRQLSARSLQSKDEEISRLLRQNAAFQTELKAAKLGAQHAVEHAQEVFSIWNLPNIIMKSVSVRGLSARWLEDDSQLGAADSSVRARLLGLLPVLLIFGVLLVFALFFMMPRYVS